MSKYPALGLCPSGGVDSSEGFLPYPELELDSEVGTGL
jgi:hypothetical protein